MRVDSKEAFEIMQERAAIAEAMLNTDALVIVDACDMYWKLWVN